MKKILLTLGILSSLANAQSIIRQDTLTVGRPAAGNKTLIFDNNAGASNPRMRWNNSTSRLELSSDGTNFIQVPAGGSGLGPTYGGTGLNSYTVGDTLYASGSNTLAKLSAGTSGYVYEALGAAAPAWTQKSLDSYRNFLLNSDFQVWQRGTSVTVANTVSTYEADRWYVKNSLGPVGVITFSQVAGVTNGSLFGASVKITTAPTSAQTNGTELYQVIENKDSKLLYGKTASFNILIKALGNVNQAGVQFYYKTTEAKVDTSIGSEQTCTVNTSTFVSCTISGQALGTSQTAAGVIGVRIRITGVSSGNTYDLNNGFVAEQAMLNVGATPSSYVRRNAGFQEEVAALQRFYEKSYPLTTAPSTGTTQDGVQTFGVAAVTNNEFYGSVMYKVTKRTNPTPVILSYTSSTSSACSGASSGTDLAANTCVPIYPGTRIFSVENTSGGTISQSVSFHWTSDAEI